MRVYTLGGTSFDLDAVRAISKFSTGGPPTFDPPSFRVHIADISKPIAYIADNDSKEAVAELQQAHDELFTAWSGKEPPGQPKEKVKNG